MQAVNSGWPCLLVPAQQGAGSREQLSLFPASVLLHLFGSLFLPPPCWPNPSPLQSHPRSYLVSGTLPREFKTIWEFELIRLLLWEWGWLCSGVGCTCLYSRTALHVTNSSYQAHLVVGAELELVQSLSNIHKVLDSILAMHKWGPV